MPDLDIDSIAEKWLNQCGPCDFGMPEYGCTHPREDYRPVLMSLVEEVKRLRLLLRSSVFHGTGVIWDRGNGQRVVIDPTEITLCFLRDEPESGGDDRG